MSVHSKRYNNNRENIWRRRKQIFVFVKKRDFKLNISVSIDKDTLQTAIDKDTLQTAIDKDTLKTTIDKDTLKTAIDKDTLKSTIDKDTLKTAIDKDTLKTKEHCIMGQCSFFHKNLILIDVKKLYNCC